MRHYIFENQEAAMAQNVFLSWLINITATCCEFLRDGAALTIARAATLRRTSLIQLTISPCSNILTLDRPVLALTLQRQKPERKTERQSEFTLCTLFFLRVLNVVGRAALK